jgi:hypothetical protein
VTVTEAFLRQFKAGDLVDVGDQDVIRKHIPEVQQQRVRVKRVAIVASFLITGIAPLNAQGQTGTIIFFREPHFATGDFKPALYCDDVELAQMQNGTYFQVSAPVGLHKCTVETSQHPPIEVNVLEGKTAYVHVGFKQGIKDHAFLGNTTEDEYNKRKPKLKPLKEWSRAALATASPESKDSAEVPSQVGSKTRDKHSGKFGDLAVNVSKLVLTPAHYEKSRAELEAFVNVANTGKGVICAEFNVTLKTTFDLQYRGFTAHAPKMQEMLPGESAEGSYVFEIKEGVQPLELVVSLKSRTYDGGSSVGTIRCGTNFPLRDVFVSDEIRLNIRDLLIRPTLPQ